MPVPPTTNRGTEANHAKDYLRRKRLVEKRIEVEVIIWYNSGMCLIITEIVMHVRFADADEHFIKTEVQGGFYTNETELVRDAVRRMREDKERAKRFQEAIAKGVQAAERGETVALTPDLLQEIKQEAVRKAHAGKPYGSTDGLPENSQA
jgi:antitoxin ParD1/3/4